MPGNATHEQAEADMRDASDAGRSARKGTRTEREKYVARALGMRVSGRNRLGWPDALPQRSDGPQALVCIPGIYLPHTPPAVGGSPARVSTCLHARHALGVAATARAKAVTAAPAASFRQPAPARPFRFAPKAGLLATAAAVVRCPFVWPALLAAAAPAGGCWPKSPPRARYCTQRHSPPPRLCNGGQQVNPITPSAG